MIDLHTHSTFSDGSLTPTELARLAVQSGVSALALTDHDTTEGVDEFLAASRVLGLKAVPGVELSADFSPGTLHMLGYWVQLNHAGLQDILGQLREGREARNRRILGKLNDLGCALSWEEVAAYAGEDNVGRPHFAMALVARGYCASKDEAFERFLAKGKAAYLDRFRLSPEAGLKVIREAGGVPVLAHPFTLQYGRAKLREYVAELVRLGLGGIEVYYSEHSAEQVAEYRALAGEFGLVATGGSDFHGSVNPDIKLGRGFGGLDVPDEVYDALARSAGRDPA